MDKRIATITRETGETSISIEINIDGNGIYSIDTGNGMFDHLIAQLSRHGLLDLTVSCKGDSNVGWHHIVEDTAIVLGRAINEAVTKGPSEINRMAHSFVPLDESLALVAVDFGGRGYSMIDIPLTETDLGDLSPQLINHFLESLATEGRFNLHARIMTGSSNHHKAEAVFKALARATRSALTIDERRVGVPSTKGSIG